MKTKIIPFDLETAKKIQAGEIEDEVKTGYGEKVRILCTDVRGDYPIVAVVTLDNGMEEVHTYNAEGRYIDRGSCHPVEDSRDLILEVPDNEPQFKPFDRVLVRDKETDKWHPSFYATTDGILYYTIDCRNWKQCIPYEGNENLVGTTNKPKEE